jgi:hypothetical protein
LLKTPFVLGLALALGGHERSEVGAQLAKLGLDLTQGGGEPCAVLSLALGGGGWRMLHSCGSMAVGASLWRW